MSMMDEMVPPVRPMSLNDVVTAGERLLQKTFPEMLRYPQPLNVERLVDEVLPWLGTRVYGEPRLQSYGVTRFADADDTVEILMQVHLYDALFEPSDRNRVFAVSTLVHEVGHALLHMPQFRTAHRAAKAMGRRPNFDGALHRRATLKAYEDPEWQAHAFGGVLVAPPTAIRMLPRYEVPALAQVFAVSVSNMQAHVKRLSSKGFVTVGPYFDDRWGGDPMR